MYLYIYLSCLLAVWVYYSILKRAITKSHKLLAALLTQSPEDCSLCRFAAVIN